MRHQLCIAAALGLLDLSVLAARLSPVPHLPASRWRVEAGPGDRVHLSSTGGVLVIDYDVDVRDWHQTGHQSLKQASIKLLLEKAYYTYKDRQYIQMLNWQGLGQLKSLVRKSKIFNPQKCRSF